MCKMRIYIGDNFKQWTRVKNFMFNYQLAGFLLQTGGCIYIPLRVSVKQTDIVQSRISGKPHQNGKVSLRNKIAKVKIKHNDTENKTIFIEY